MMRTITALYDSMSDAQDAVNRLVQAGVSRESVSVIDQSKAGGTTASASASTTGSSRSGEDTGFFASLRDLFVPDEDRYTYAEGIRRGGALLTAKVDDSKTDHVLEVLESTGAVDLDTRESEWRAQGWTGGSAAGMGAASGYEAHGTATAATGATTRGQEDKIQLVEEELRVGKREVGRGGVRVRSYVVETPVQEQVTLRDEHVHVERRAVDRPAEEIAQDAELFRERTIELSERDEEAVVSKTARVKEEVLLRKDVEQRTETVSDKVRRTEVEVERVEGDATARGTATGGAVRTDVERDRNRKL